MSSFFRGSRQDSRDHRDRDRDVRSGGGGRSNLPFRNNAPNRVNPWEGGIAPGVGGITNRPLAGLLPTPSAAGGLLQQLSTHGAQAQLALASNVLNALLPTLQTSQANQVPSLLSLNTNRGCLLSLNASPGPPFQGLAFGGQPPRLDTLGPNRQKPRSSPKRPEPYNKMANRNQRPGQKLDDQKGPGVSPRSGARSPALTSKKGTQQTKNFKLEDTKRAGERSDSERAEKRKLKEEKESGRDTASSQNVYADIPEHMFNCHVCNKRMWDAVSFNNHVKGRAHQLMIDQLDESYKIKIELMRHEMKVDEQQRQIEMQRKQRQGKNVGSQSHEYCTMCDLHFIGSLPLHRKSDSHQQLKSFIHPKCRVCSKEFSNRLEWDQHQLTPGHLKHASENKSQSHSKQVENNGKKDVKESQEKPKSSNDKVKMEPLWKSPETSTCKTVASPQAPKSEVSKPEVKKTENLEKKAENVAKKVENVVIKTETVSKENTEEKPLHIAEYDSSKVIGSEMLEEKTGFLCRCCNRFIFSQVDVKTHCRSLYHYEKYVLHMNNLRKTTQGTSKQSLPNAEKKTDPKDLNQKESMSALNQGGAIASDVKKDDDTVSSADKRKVTGPVEEGHSDKKNEEEKDVKNREENDITKKIKEEKNDGAMEQDEEDDMEEEDISWKRRRISKDGNDKESREEMDEGGINSLELDGKKLWEEIDADRDLGALLQAVDKDVNASQEAVEEEKEVSESNEDTISSNAPTPRGRRGRGGSALRFRSRKRK